MAETGEETYYIVGESRTNVDNAITKVYGSFFIAFEVIPSTGEIIQTDCSRTLELTNDFIRKLFLHKHLETDAKVIEEAIRRRYHGSSWKALIVAYRDALKHYQRAMAAEAEEEGKKVTTEKNEEMTSEEVLTCAINIGEQLLVSGAEISRVEDTIRRICNAYGIRQSHIFSIASCIIVTLETKERKWITQTRRILSYGTDMWKLDRLNDLSRRICATQPSFAVIDQEYEKILKGPTYSPAVQCGIYAMTAGAFAIFFGGNLWDGFASLFVGALIRVTLYALSAIKLKAIFSNILCSLISGMACILVCYLGIGQHVEMIMIGNIMLLIPGVLMTNSFRDFISGDMISGLLHFSEAMITAVCVAAGFILSKILLGGML